MQEATFKPGDMLDVLRRRKVKFIVVGGVCARLHGCLQDTEDLDIVTLRTPNNLIALEAAMFDDADLDH